MGKTKLKLVSDEHTDKHARARDDKSFKSTFGDYIINSHSSEMPAMPNICVNSIQ